MNSQNPYGGYSAPPPRGAGRGGPQLPNRPPPPMSYGPGGGAPSGAGPAGGSGYSGPPPLHLGRGGPPPSYGQNYGPGARESYNSGPPPPAMGGGVRPPIAAPQYGGGGGMGYDAGPPDNGYGGPASRFAPNSGPPPRPIGMGGPPAPYGSQYGGGNGWNDDAGQQPRKRSRTDHGGGDGGRGGGGGPGPRGGNELEYQDFLKERLKRERPGRTLFVRNIDFRCIIPELRQQFESFGEVKSWFDLIEKRGIAFISYFDIRSAEAAKEAMQAYRINGRELDVHYSLPRESELSRRCDRDKDQGTILAILRGGDPNLSDDEVRSVFSQFGDLRDLRLNDQYTGRLVDFWDCRATKRAYDSLVNSPYRGGTWELSFEWDLGMENRMPDMQKHERDRERLRSMNYQPGEAGPRPGTEGQFDNEGGSGAGYARGSSHDSGQGSYGRGAGGYGQYGQQQPSAPSGYGPPSGGGPQYGGGGMKRGYDHDNSSSQEPPMRRWGQPANSNNGPSGNGGQSYGTPPVQPGSRPIAGLPPSSSTFSPTAQPNAGPGAGSSDRLEQAQKVQQLLASLKSGGGANAAGSPPNRPPSASTPNATAAVGTPASGSNSSAALPSNIAALLQMAQSKSGGNQK